MALFSFGKKSNIDTGINLMKQAKYDEAIAFFRDAINTNPKDKEIYLELARAYFKKNNFVETKNTLLSLLQLDPDEDETQRILEITNYKKIVSDKYFNTSPKFSPDGEKIVYVSARKDTDYNNKLDVSDCGGVYLLDLKTMEERLLVSDKYYNSAPCFSPDGTKVLCLSARRDSDNDGLINPQDIPELCVVDLNTGEEQLYIAGEWRFKHPSFTNDGKKVLFCGWRPGTYQSGIYIWDLETGSTRRFGLENCDHTFPSHSVDGKMLVYTSWRDDTNGDGIINIKDNSGIYVYDLEKNVESILVSDSFDNRFPSFSPDNQEIVFLARRRDTNKDGRIDSLDHPGVYLINIQTKKEKNVVSDRYYNLFPSFCCDGKKIIFLGSWRRTRSREEAPSDYFENKGIYVVDCDGKNERQVVDEKYYGCRAPTPSPTKPQIVYLAWRKGTSRGLYLADYENLPTIKELEDIIKTNI